MNWGKHHCPSWPGGVSVPKRKYCEATFVGTDGVVVHTRTNHSHPSSFTRSRHLRQFVPSQPPLSHNSDCPPKSSQTPHCRNLEFIYFLSRPQNCINQGMEVNMTLTKLNPIFSELTATKDRLNRLF